VLVAAALDLVEAGVRRGPVEPGVDRGALLEAGERAPRAQLRLLRDVLRVVELPARIGTYGWA
jgi:hypothetical protein